MPLHGNREGLCPLDLNASISPSGARASIDETLAEPVDALECSE